ncbi:MarR family transcriptional regulator [Fulvivirga maritima]|nr:MarR family transcriptional regulator [Fulvivirga maritima]UII25278.1 MarR family transcriptional regulator [Fulvivirga maritima]
MPQLLTLKYLQRQEGCKATHGQISKYLNLNNSTVTGIVNRLTLKGLLSKEQDVKDKRIVYALLTEQGKMTLSGTPQLMHDELTAKLSNLTPKKLQQIEQAFQLVIEVIGIQDIEPNPLYGTDDVEPITDK